MVRISSSAATTSAGAFGAGRRDGLRWSWDHAAEQEIRADLESEVGAERRTSLDRSLRDISDEGGGVVDLRPAVTGEDPELRRLMVGRAAKLERLGLAEQVGPAQWTLKLGFEPALRDLGIRGDKTITDRGHEPDVAGFATSPQSRSSADWSSEASTTS